MSNPSRIRCFGLGLLVSLAFGLTACSTNEVDVASLTDKVRKILQLHTYELVYKDVSYVADVQKIFGWDPLTMVDNRTLFSVNVRVRAGIDFQKGLTITPIRDVPNQPITRLRVQLPPPSILLVDADEKSIHEYFSIQFGKAIAMQDWEPQIAKAKERITADAVKRGILQKAQENAQRMLKNFFALAGFETVEFTTEAPLAPTPQGSPK